MRKGEAGLEETTARCKNWLRHLDVGAVTLVPEADLLDEALSLSLEIRHNLQDCLYLAAARRLDATLITADETFYKRAKPSFKGVSLLPGYGTN